MGRVSMKCLEPSGSIRSLSAIGTIGSDGEH